MVNFCKSISASKWFQNLVTIAILVAGVLVGIATYPRFSSEHEIVLEVLNEIILGVFIIEIVVKVIAEGRKPWLYFTDGWNVFDFIIVAAAFLPFGGSSIAILRLLRLLRVLKLIKALPKLQMLVGALLKSIPSMGYVSILLLLLFYIYAVAGVFFFSENDPIHFQDLQRSMLSLFRVVTLEDWTDIMYINMFGCENYGYDGNMNLCINSKGSLVLSVTYFVSFVLIGTMIFLNLFIGVIMNGMDDAKNEMLLESQVQSGEKDTSIEDVESKIYELQELLVLYKIQQKDDEI
ncbi:voltage-gated sodium channel [Aquimarina sp. EL_43]|uniref:ion transporter n=1 Tax=Aquimarina TaxID=290174 RepID=UPI00046F67B1|nr:MULTISPECIES: ion transporter [Aquimarina]MBG6132553.1 voltage-gated sodium channel [Aquimarina sp. EL_35]MBG6152684.1 voltage-gated sodium channel [Aquimarina sp. EL_32]MBG6170691.1 voltage-gated sodium channel [Aquimarina sp. EL_43]